MLSLNIPLLMVGAFLLSTLVVGLYYSRKATTLREYAVGNKRFATETLVATVLATTWGGGGLVRTVQEIHATGLYYISAFLFSALGFWVISPLAVRMAPFMQHLSMSETIGSVYGKYPRILSALSSIGVSIATLAAQITVMSQAISMCCVEMGYLNNPRIMTIVATLILIGYSAFGGIRSVTFTDVLQFATFSIIIPLLAAWMFYKIGKPVADIMPFLKTQAKFQPSTVFHFDTKLLAIVALVLSDLVYNIEPTTMQRAYMSSGPIQAQKVFLYSGLFCLFITVFIILIGLFVFIGEPHLPKTETWSYIMAHIPPFFKGLLPISLLAMTMSTADSTLNACSVMVSHDIVESVQDIKLPSAHRLRIVRWIALIIGLLAKAVPYAHPLRLARLTSLIVGLAAMMLAFKYNDLLKILFLVLDLSVPIIPAPFILAIFGFRGTARTALIGMATGVLSIMAWNKWVTPATGIDGSFVCMLINGLTMMAAHYLLPQPEGAGWVAPDDEFKQMQQAKARKQARQKEEIKALFTREGLAKLKPNAMMLISMGGYSIATALVGLVTCNSIVLACWPLLQIAAGGWSMAYAVFFKKPTPDWIVGRYWFIGLISCLPISVLWQLGHYGMDPVWAVMLSLAHLTITLWLLPFYWGIRCVVAVLLISFIIYPMLGIGMPMLLIPTVTLLPLLGFGLLVFAIIIYAKLKITAQDNQNCYLKNKEKLRQGHQIKSMAYTLSIHPSATRNELKEDGNILQQVTQDVTQSVSFIDNDKPLSKEDFQSIINKFSEWATFLKRKAKARDHMLLQPTEITLDALIDKLEVALEREIGRVPRLLIEKIEEGNTSLPTKIICDLNQTIHLLVTAVLRMADLDHIETQLVKIQLQTTYLQYMQGDPNDDACPLMFPAIAILIHNAASAPELRPKVQSYYKEVIEDKEPKKRGNQRDPERIDPDKKTIEHIVQTHYGVVEAPNQDNMLLVLPWDVTHIQNKMISKWPIERLTSEGPITIQEQGDSVLELMNCHDFICLAATVDSTIIAEILLLLRHCYGYKRHPSGQLFYVRAAGIAQLVAQWMAHSPKPIYATLLYDAVRYTRLPLSYIKKNYNLGVLCFVDNVLGVDKHQEMEQALFQVKNRFKDAVSKKQLSVLYIKLAERLYDLRHAEGYANREEVKYMAQETLMVDVKLARQYLEPGIADTLSAAAQLALVFCKDKEQDG